MFEGASPILFQYAKEPRNNMTAAEMTLLMHLRNKINGLKFRRQHPIGLYVADFYCHKLKLIIEVDGSIHNLPEVDQKDRWRQKDLEAMGYEIVRFSNKEVLNQIEMVLETIKQVIERKSNGLNQKASSRDEANE